MNHTPDGGPAFPYQKDVVLYNGSDKSVPAQTIRGVWSGGMSLRDYFAAKWLSTVVTRVPTDADIIAAQCYQMADAMLRAREK